MTALRVISGGEPSTPSPRLHDEQAEQALLANVVYDDRALVELRGWLLPEHFGSESHRRIYETACALQDAGKPVNCVEVVSALRVAGRLEQVGGSAFLMELPSKAPVFAPVHVRAHGHRIKACWARRAFKALGQELESRSENDSADVLEMLERARVGVDEISGAVSEGVQETGIRHVAERLFKSIHSRSSEASPIGLTGFPELDRHIVPAGGELVLLAARPGMGKTALASAIAIHTARNRGGVLFASLETSEGTLLTRMICSEYRVELRAMLENRLSQTDWSSITRGIADVSKLPMSIESTPSTGVAELRAACRRFKTAQERAGGSLALVVVDYVQLLRAPRPRMSREETVSENVRAMKAMAMELGCPVLGLAQLNRAVESRDGKRPQLSDLRESGELEQCARLVLTLYREDYYRRRESGYVPNGLADVEIAKQNNGPDNVVVQLGFDSPKTRFFSQ